MVGAEELRERPSTSSHAWKTLYFYPEARNFSLLHQFFSCCCFAFRGVQLQTHSPYLVAVSELLLSGAAPSEQREPQHSPRCFGLGNYSCLPFCALEQRELSVQAALAGCEQQSGPRIALGPDRAQSQNSWHVRKLVEGERSHWEFWLSDRAPKNTCTERIEESSTGLSSSCPHTSHWGFTCLREVIGPLWAGGLLMHVTSPGAALERVWVFPMVSKLYFHLGHWARAAPELEGWVQTQVAGKLSGDRGMEERHFACLSAVLVQELSSSSP